MEDDVKYVLDANIFIQAHRLYYSFDLVPAFWLFLIHVARASIRSIDRVYDEIAHLDERGNPKDELAEWAITEADFLFESTDESNIVPIYQEIIEWALGSDQFTNEAKDIFADGADAWIVAYAKACGVTVVTQETYEPAAKKRVKIPNACQTFGVSYVDTFDMLRDLGFFVNKYARQE